MDMEASTVARRAESPAEVRMIGLRAEPEPRPLSASSTSIAVNVVNVVADVVGGGGGGRAEWASRCERCANEVGHHHLDLSTGSRTMVELSERQKYESLARVSISTKDA